MFIVCLANKLFLLPMFMILDEIFKKVNNFNLSFYLSFYLSTYLSIGVYKIIIERGLVMLEKDIKMFSLTNKNEVAIRVPNLHVKEGNLKAGDKTKVWIEDGYFITKTKINQKTTRTKKTISEKKAAE